MGVNRNFESTRCLADITIRFTMFMPSRHERCNFFRWALMDNATSKHFTCHSCQSESSWGLIFNQITIAQEVLLTSSSVFAKVCRVEICLSHKISVSTKQTVWELLVQWARRTLQHDCKSLTASTKSPAASKNADMTWGVIILLVGLLMLSTSTSTGSNFVASAMRRFTSSM